MAEDICHSGDNLLPGREQIWKPPRDWEELRHPADLWKAQPSAALLRESKPQHCLEFFLVDISSFE